MTNPEHHDLATVIGLIFARKYLKALPETVREALLDEYRPAASPELQGQTQNAHRANLRDDLDALVELTAPAPAPAEETAPPIIKIDPNSDPDAIARIVSEVLAQNPRAEFAIPVRFGTTPTALAEDENAEPDVQEPCS